MYEILSMISMLYPQQRMRLLQYWSEDLNRPNLNLIHIPFNDEVGLELSFKTCKNS
jgi:hypothetical protein